MNAKNRTPSAAKSPDVLSQPFDEKNVPVAWRPHFHRLLALREKLLKETGELEQSTQSETPSLNPHLADVATDSFDRDLAYGLLSMEENALIEIDAALQRIRDGSYGMCERSGERIPQERLNAIPWTRYTTKAQADLEAEGQAPHPHLNPIASVRSEQPRSTK